MREYCLLHMFKREKRIEHIEAIIAFGIKNMVRNTDTRKLHRKFVNLDFN